jgi:hypothetical protein
MEQEQEQAYYDFMGTTRKSPLYGVGELYWDAVAGRFGINGHELHCGDCLEVLLFGEWVQTRLEKAKDWYLTDVPKFLEVIPNATIICRKLVY